ncbi:hypothetical protein LtaPh_2311300 [Leishmania tarentolae]|uniref:Uncharacterized protein n=1 Tax=Leishmania tarentolae TaxID=5689 RepID=A0A640KHE8_LEITA|nr:hypothetical protein LtaPh_2311300 [Leishmania tarentolae]
MSLYHRSCQERYEDASAEMPPCALRSCASKRLPFSALDPQRPVGEGFPVTHERVSPAAFPYPSQQPRQAHNWEQAATRGRPKTAATSPEEPLHSPSGPYMYGSSSTGTGTGASTPFSKGSQQRRQGPSSVTQAAIPGVYEHERLHHHRPGRVERRHLTPRCPWPGGAETSGDLMRGTTHHSPPSMFQRRATADDVPPRTVQADRGLVEVHRLPTSSRSTPPPLRSRVCSPCKSCRPRPRSPSARSQVHLDTFSNTAQEADEGTSPLAFVDPGAYRIDHREAQTSRAVLGPCGTSASAHQLGRQSEGMSSAHPLVDGVASTSLSLDSTQPQGTFHTISSSTQTTSDSDTEAMPQRTGLRNILANTTAPACRLRVYQESTNHPSGFAVPRRGAGTAAPVRINWNSLGALPQTAADRHAIERAAHAVPRSLIYGADNHASASALVAYRQGVAAETGIDPAQLRHGPLSTRYDRVKVEFGESIVEQADSGCGRPSLASTTTRLRVGASRPSELYDPISGLARKPNEVPSAYLQSIVAADAAQRHFGPTLSMQGDTATVVSYCPDDGVPHTSRDAPGNSSSVSTKRPIGGGAFAWTDKFSGLVRQRRMRATARSEQLHSTHRVTGLPLRSDERRLYWAEHAPLHTTSVRGLNAVLQGVGEAEEGLLGEGVDPRNEWGKGECTGRGASRVCTNVVVHAEDEAGVAVDHRHASTDARCCLDDGDGNDREAWPAGVMTRLHRWGGRESGGCQPGCAPLHHPRLLSGASKSSAFSFSNPALVATCPYDSHGGAADASRAHVEDTHGLVDSHVREDVTTDIENGARTRCSEHDGLSYHRAASDPYMGMPPMVHSGRTLPLQHSHSHEQSESGSRGDDHLFLYSPLLTPLLQEVDMRLRVHRLPTMVKLWRWGVGDQEAILQIAGFSQAERKTILWELERTIRVSSTGCALSAAS